MSNNALRTLLTAFIAGDREGAAQAAKDALDGYVHDFIFPEDAVQDDLGDLGDANIVNDEIDDVEDPFLPDENDIEDSNVMPDIDTPMADDQVDVPMDPLDDTDDDLDPNFTFEALDLDMQQDDSTSDDLEVPGQNDDDAALGSIADGLGVTGDDVTDIEEIPSDDGVGDNTGGEVHPNVVSVSIDPDQGDDVVSAVKVIYDNDTDFTFFTFARDAQRVVDLVQELCCGDEGISNMSVDDLTTSLQESVILL